MKKSKQARNRKIALRLQKKAEAETERLKQLGWTRQDFAKSLIQLLEKK